MLSSHQQDLLLQLYIKYMDSGMKTKDTKPIYKSTLSFYKSVKYLTEAGYVFKVREQDNTNTYFLTLKGEILARCLCSLPELPNGWKRMAMSIKIPLTAKRKNKNEEVFE